MKNRHLYSIWAGLAVLCALLGTVNEPQGFVKALMALAAVGFFIPGGILLFRAIRQEDVATLRLLRLLCIASLAVTLVLFIITILCVTASETVGLVLHALLVIFSVPMFCMPLRVLGLFGWACLLAASFLLKKRENR